MKEYFSERKVSFFPPASRGLRLTALFRFRQLRQHTALSHRLNEKIHPFLLLSALFLRNDFKPVAVGQYPHKELLPILGITLRCFSASLEQPRPNSCRTVPP